MVLLEMILSVEIIKQYSNQLINQPTRELGVYQGKNNCF